MAALVGYASSDEDEDASPYASSPKVIPYSSTSTMFESHNLTHELKSPPTKDMKLEKATRENFEQGQGVKESASSQPPPPQSPSTRPEPPESSPSLPQRQTIGPVPLGPSLPPPESILAGLPEPSGTSTPSSPYTAARSLIHDLTLPSVANFDIPPSPPGSPPPQTTSKFRQFLSLKRQGTHFNGKLEQSAALRNPSLADKLLSFVDLSGTAQYETTLPLELYDPSGFPEWSHRDKLRKAREEVVKEREDKTGGRSSIEFVSGTVHSPITGGGISREKRKGGWK
ncbi:HCNGP-like protein [Metarhizium album ARSEF 1941]|uniref:HCNGP-like protein n=1 Tax=Metarhizium album (strain ARSEF 1941) TaxID=1081103 RepID=A0A0B2WUY1_METAS|nr:HCNGP-like protein [Metarhizium album ARSEF 1941]KHN99906.1 HCNGP-like protein [Metarhizium album ARSEF 1941]